MTQSEVTGMVVVALTTIIGLMIIVANTTWKVSKTNAEISSTLKILLKISDTHEKEIESLKTISSRNSTDIEIIHHQCKFAHKFDD